MSFTLIQTSIEEVTKELKAINPSKAYGPDQIPGRLLGECTSEIAPSLTRLINLSLRIGCVPKDWKCANIVPVFISLIRMRSKRDIKMGRLCTPGVQSSELSVGV